MSFQKKKRVSEHLWCPEGAGVSLLFFFVLFFLWGGGGGGGGGGRGVDYFAPEQVY